MSKKLNGSVDILAKAMRQVFTEAVEEAVEPLRSDMSERFDGVEGRLDNLERQGATMDKRLTSLERQGKSHQKALDGIKNRMPAKGKQSGRPRAAERGA